MCLCVWDVWTVLLLLLLLLLFAKSEIGTRQIFFRVCFRFCASVFYHVLSWGNDFGSHSIIFSSCDVWLSFMSVRTCGTVFLKYLAAFHASIFILFLSNDIMQAQSCHITLAKVLLNPYSFINHVNFNHWKFEVFQPKTLRVTLASRVSAIDGSGQTRDYADAPCRDKRDEKKENNEKICTTKNTYMYAFHTHDMRSCIFSQYFLYFS